KTIHSLEDLKQFGIRALTGEACRVIGSGRVLCDLTDEGMKTVADLLGLQPALKPPGPFCANWNSGAVASFMLPRSMFRNLAEWCLLSAGCDRVMSSDDGIYGLEPGDNEDQWNELYDLLQRQNCRPHRLRVNRRLPGEGMRCEHQASERIT